MTLHVISRPSLMEQSDGAVDNLLLIAGDLTLYPICALCALSGDLMRSLPAVLAADACYFSALLTSCCL